MKQDNVYDMVIVGGGINGTGIAAAAALRGLKVFLCEQGDLASGTSSASSKLIHGGLRYLENYEFSLVKEALEERERLLKIAKHLVKPQSFILPNQPKTRSRWLVRLGLFLYDHLGRHCSLPKTKSINLTKHLSGKYLKSQFRTAFEFSDCCTNDARLVIANAQKARELGAIISSYTQCTGVRQDQNHWELSLYDHRTKKEYSVQSKVLVNATGPWVEPFLKSLLDVSPKHGMALVKGSHIVIPKFYEGDFAYFLQNDDKRVIFVIPYMQDYLLIGTTDIAYSEETLHPEITLEEINYLLKGIARYFALEPHSLEIVHTFSGVRPLLKDSHHNPTAITRGYFIELTRETPPLISIFGGKLTTFRSLSENVLSSLEFYFPNMKPYQEDQMILPGSHYDNDQQLQRELQNCYPELPQTLLHRYQQLYGTATHKLLTQCSDLTSLGKDFGCSLYEKEVDYLVKEEWVMTTEDILWRRTHIGYFFPKENLPLLEEYLTKKHSE